MHHPTRKTGHLWPSTHNSFSAFLLVLLLLFSSPVCAQPTSEQPSEFYFEIQRVIQDQNLTDFMSLAVPSPEKREQLQKFFEDFLTFKSTRTVIQLVEETKVRIVLHVLMQRQDESTFQSWAVLVEESENKKQIKGVLVLSSIDGLYRLRLSHKAVPISNITITHFDSIFELQSGFLFPILAGGKPTGAVFLGKGNFVFAPSDPREQHQLILFNKKPRLQTSINQVFLRASSSTLRSMFGTISLEEGISKPDMFEKAQEISRQGNLNAFGIQLPFGDELWFPRLLGADVYTELKSEAGDLVYQYAPKEMEDILLLDRRNDRIISLYSSAGAYSAVPENAELEILSYKMTLSYNPSSTYLSGVSEIRLRSNEVSSSVVFKLNPTLRVTRIDGTQGSLIYFQEKNTHNLHVVMSEILEVDHEMTLRFHYQGRIEPDKGRAEVQSISGTEIESEYFLPPSYLYSNSAQWYPQLITRPYSPLEISISVPSDYAAISNGELKKTEDRGERMVFTYDCDQPIKYFSLLVGRMNASISHKSIVPMNVFFYSLDRSKAQQQAQIADRILRFYEEYFGKYPYASLNLALRPAQEPGGHAPATFVVANRVYSFSQSRVGKDPLNIPDFPEFFLAHEIAHQWWGQAVGWRSYRDQWLSEGFAHFAAAEYIRSERGDEAWLKLSRIFYTWVENKTKAGPIWLGSRLGHLTEDPQAFSALLYNKGAYILEMLKNWIGREKFSACLADFFEKFKHSKASIEDFRQVTQRYSSDDLDPFFDQWLSRWDIPEVKWSYSVRKEGDGAVLNLRFAQSSKQPYFLKLPVIARSPAGKEFQTEVLLNKTSQEFDIPVPFNPKSVEVDPLRTNLAKISQ